jgi:hypothetical protein
MTQITLNVPNRLLKALLAFCSALGIKHNIDDTLKVQSTKSPNAALIADIAEGVKEAHAIHNGNRSKRSLLDFLDRESA